MRLTRTSIFRVVGPADCRITGGRHSGGGRGTAKSPRERENFVLEDNLLIYEKMRD